MSTIAAPERIARMSQPAIRLGRDDEGEVLAMLVEGRPVVVHGAELTLLASREGRLVVRARAA